MKEDVKSQEVYSKEHNRILIIITLLGICFTLFTFLIAFNKDILKENTFLTLQLVCAIPLFMTSLLAKVKASHITGRNRWAALGFQTYLWGYTLLINVVGIFLFSFISLSAGIVFYAMNIVSALIYSGIEISYNPQKSKERMIKDLEFILILILLGLLPALKFY